MMKMAIAMLCLAMAVSTAVAGEANIAKEALRDGLFEVARRHADASDGEVGKLIILESHVREEHWGDVLAALVSWGNPTGVAFAYYRALASFKLGNIASARTVLDETDFSKTSFERQVARLRAEIMLVVNDSEAAIKSLAKDESMPAKMLSARAMEAKGDHEAAAKIWREVLLSTNADEKTYSVAAANLADLPALSNAYATAVSPSVRRFAGLRFGVQLIKTRSGFPEGAKIIETIARDVPDSDGAMDAFLQLAEVRFDRGEYTEAVNAFEEAMEMWPQAAKFVSVQLSLGSSFMKAGRLKEALVAFNTAANLADTDELRAVALAKKAELKAAESQQSEAIELYREVLKRYPATSVSREVAQVIKLYESETAAKELFVAYRFDEALKAFTDIAASDPSRLARMRYYSMLCLYGLGRDAEAEAMARDIADRERDLKVRSEALAWLAKFHFNRGRWHDAENEFLAAAKLVDDEAEAAGLFLWSARSALSANDYKRAVQLVTDMVAKSGDAALVASAMLVQAQALIELARFDEAVLVLERVIAGVDAGERLQAMILRADALFAMGADNPARYREALEAYRLVIAGESLNDSQRLLVDFKVARALEKLKLVDEAIDQYYSKVVLAYRDGRLKGIKFDEDARTAFSRAAFCLAEEFESRGMDEQAINMLSLVVSSDVPSADEAAKRIKRIRRKGRFL